MKIKSLLVFIMLTTVFFNGCALIDPCTSKESFLNELSATVEKVKNEGSEYTKEEWVEMDKKMDRLLDECYPKYEDEMTNDETKDLLIWSATYAYARQKGNIDDFMEMMRDMNLDDTAKEFIAQADENLKKIFNEELKGDLEKVVDEALDGFGKLAKDLKDAWEETKEK